MKTDNMESFFMLSCSCYNLFIIFYFHFPLFCFSWELDTHTPTVHTPTNHIPLSSIASGIHESQGHIQLVLIEVRHLLVEAAADLLVDDETVDEGQVQEVKENPPVPLLGFGLFPSKVCGINYSKDLCQISKISKINFSWVSKKNQCFHISKNFRGI